MAKKSRRNRSRSRKTRRTRRQRGGTYALTGTTMTPDTRINTPGLNTYNDDPSRMRMSGGTGVLGFLSNFGNSMGSQTTANQINSIPTTGGLSLQAPSPKAMI